MVKLLVLIVGLVAIAVAVKVALEPTAGGAAASEPRRQLDNVRTKAQELQKELQDKADRADVAR